MAWPYMRPAQSVRVLDADGALIAELIGGEGGARQSVDSLEDFSPYLLHAVVALENERFFEDPGWDLLAIGRAVVQNVLAGEITSGASTITQQLARILILRDTTVSAERKLREIVIAAELARRYDKNDLLLLYLNEVNFGNPGVWRSGRGAVVFWRFGARFEPAAGGYAGRNAAGASVL